MSPCRPTRPPDFLTIHPENIDGYYVFGFPDFQVRPLKVANIFHRSFAGAHEDFILGVLSVLLIALLTEIFQAVLMRTYKRRVTRSGFQAAFVLDEVTHFRNIFSHVRYRSRSRISKSVMWSSLTILTIGAILIAAEVVAVYVTQPFKLYAPPDRYNLRGIQPIGTTPSTAIDVDKLIDKKRCVTPMMPNSNRSREFSISACVDRTEHTVLKEVNSKSTYVEIGSWFHQAGSDHVIWYGDGETEGKLEMSTRASIMQSELNVTNHLRFENIDKDYTFARYLQGLAMSAAIKANCDQFSGVDCDELYSSCETEPPTKPNETNVTYWEVKDAEGHETPHTGKVKGLVTRYKIEMNAPGLAIPSAYRVFATSAAIKEVLDDKGMYVSMPDGRKLETIERLVSEEGRIAGVVLLGMILLGLLFVLVLLRVILKPISLARLARDTIEEEDDDFVDDDDDYVGGGPDSSNQSVWALERDIVEPDLDDYGSTDTFDIPQGRPPRRGFWRPNDRGPV